KRPAGAGRSSLRALLSVAHLSRLEDDAAAAAVGLRNDAALLLVQRDFGHVLAVRSLHLDGEPVRITGAGGLVKLRGIHPVELARRGPPEDLAGRCTAAARAGRHCRARAATARPALDFGAGA